MFQIDPFSLIPDSLKNAVRDAAVNFVADQAKKLLGEEIGNKIKKLRSDAGFAQKFDNGLQKALQRFVNEYAEQDEDLVVAISADASVFKNEQVQKALLEMLKNPGKYLAQEQETVAENFASVLPGRKNRERVDKAMAFLLRCLAEEMWNLPELQPIYNLQFQKMTAESMQQQVELQKAQLQALTTVNEGVRQALLQLTDAIAEKKLLPAPDGQVIPVRPKVLHNLPQPDYGGFVGREKELAQIESLLSPKSRHFLVTIDGIGGIGKSTIALEIAHRYLQGYDKLPIEERFDAIIWVSAKQTVLTADGIKQRPRVLQTLDDIYTTVAITLQKEDIIRAPAVEQPELVQRALAQQRTLVIVDNLETVDDESVVSFLRELPIPTKAIITSRYRIDIAYPIRLKQLRYEDAYALISQECKKREINIRDEDSLNLYSQTDGVPLAMVWSVSQIAAGYSVQSVLRKLAQREGDVNKYCFMVAFAQIEGQTSEKLLQILGLLAKDASREELGFISQVDEITRDDGLARLEKLSLVNKYAERFSVLQLTKNYILATLNPDNEKIFRLQALKYYANQFKSIKDTDAANDMAYTQKILANNRENVLGLIDWAISARCHKEVIEAIHSIHYAFWRHGFWSILNAYLMTGIQISIESNEFSHAALFEKYLGRIFRIQGYFEQSELHLKRSLEYFEQLRDDIQILEVKRSIAMLYVSRSEFAEAEEIFNSCLKRIDELEDFPNRDETIAHILNNYTEILLRNQNHSKAEEFINRVQSISEANHLLGALVVNYRMRGRLFMATGNLEQARDAFWRGLELSEKAQIIPDQAYAMKWLSRVALKNNDLANAKKWADKAFNIFQSLDMKSDMSQTQDILASIEEKSVE